MEKKNWLIPFTLILLLLIGTVGFCLIEGWGFFDALYMSVITLTTVGYQEIHPLSEQGRIFNMLYIGFGIGSFTYFLSKMYNQLNNLNFETRRITKMKKKISLLKRHTIVCGYGRMGEVICRKLAEQNIDFVVIERRDSVVNELKKTPFLFLEGDSANEEVLSEAGIQNAKILVSVIDNDSDGLYTSLAGRSMNPNLFIIARATENQAKKRMLRAGADRVILPFVMSGLKVAECVLNPAVEDLFDISGMQEKDEDKIQLADLFVTENSRLINSSLSNVGEQLGNLIVVGVKNQENKFQFKPGSDYVFNVGDCIITLASKKTYDEARLRFRLSTHI